jgi:hypothetical protein
MLLAPGASAQTWGRERVPSNGVCFYEHIDFGGRYFCARVGADADDVPSGTNDEISSIRIFGNAEVIVFRNPNFGGSSRRFVSDTGDLRRSGWNDRISSFRIEGRGSGGGGNWGRPARPSSGVCFYEHPNFGGDYFCARAGSNTSQVPPDTNDRISSIQIFGNAEVTVFRDIDFQGSSRRFANDMTDLRSAGWNDRISSYRVRGRGQGGNWGGSRPTHQQAQQIVRRAYLSVLGREPDPGSSGYVDAVMNDGWNQQRVEAELRKSEEYRNKVKRQGEGASPW